MHTAHVNNFQGNLEIFTYQSFFSRELCINITLPCRVKWEGLVLVVVVELLWAEKRLSKEREFTRDEFLRLDEAEFLRPSIGCFINELIDEATFKPWRLSRLVFLPVELFVEVVAPPPEVAPPDVEAAIEAAPVAPWAELLTSLLLLEPAEMSLAGPVAEAIEIFSSSNSAGPKKYWKMAF